MQDSGNWDTQNDVADEEENQRIGVEHVFPPVGDVRYGLAPRRAIT